MNINDITNIISSTGFPILMCILMFYYIREINKDHRDECDKITEAVNSNTIVITKLFEALESNEVIK